MSYLPALFNGMATLASTVWTAAATNGVWQAMDLSSQSFEDEAKAGKIPSVAMDFNLRPTDEWGMTNHAEAGEVTLYYVKQSDGGIASAVAQAEALRDYVGANGFAGGQLTDWPAVRYDMELPANRYFLSAKKPFVAAAVVLQVVCGVTNP